MFSNVLPVRRCWNLFENKWSYDEGFTAPIKVDVSASESYYYKDICIFEDATHKVNTFIWSEESRLFVYCVVVVDFSTVAR